MPKQDLSFRTPICNAPGSLGFYPDLKRMPEIAHLGAFFTNPISLHSRTPASDRCVLPYSGGILLHSGYPNPGLTRIVKICSSRWADSPVPVIPHLLVESIFQLNEMIERLDGLTNLAAISLSFPENLPDIEILSWLDQIICELPLILQVPPARLPSLANFLQETQVSALSMSASRGTLPNQDEINVTGRLFGPALFPQTLQQLVKVMKNHLPVITAGGIYTQEQIDTCLTAGALAIQLDAVLWMGKLIR
jgi:dihydroorotate dehydrogenase (NAD+) catalytic subunit